ncbi:MAG: F0F1 ATP synthase subunit B' [Geminicoccaceae bacterium]
MPQIDVSTFASQIFWLILAFAALYWLLSRKALPRVAEILEARQDRIAADLDRAQRLRREAEEALKEYEETLARAHAESQGLLSETLERLEAYAAERLAELDAQLGRQLAEAGARIAKARQAALDELEEATIAVAQAATERLAGLKITKNAAQAALEDVLKEAA